VLALQLALRCLDIERHELDAAAAFQPAALLPHVGREAIEAGPQIRTEPGLRGIEAREERLLVRAQKERLRQIGRFLRIRAPLEPHVLEHGCPVRAGQRVERRTPNIGLLAAERSDDGMAGERKPSRHGRPIVVGKLSRFLVGHRGRCVV